MENVAKSRKEQGLSVEGIDISQKALILGKGVHCATTKDLQNMRKQVDNKDIIGKTIEL